MKKKKMKEKEKRVECGGEAALAINQTERQNRDSGQVQRAKSTAFCFLIRELEIMPA